MGRESGHVLPSVRERGRLAAFEPGDHGIHAAKKTCAVLHRRLMRRTPSRDLPQPPAMQGVEIVGVFEKAGVAVRDATGFGYMRLHMRSALCKQTLSRSP